MTKLIGENISLQREDYDGNASVSESAVKKVAKKAQWVGENAADLLGDVKKSALSVENFAKRKGYDHTETDISIIPWVLHTGQSIVGSDLHIEEGYTDLADLVANEGHIAQALNDAALNTYQTSQNKAHTHSTTLPANKVGGGSNGFGITYTTASSDEGGSYGGLDTSATFGSSSQGGSVSRPNRVMYNIFVKINE